MKTFCREERVQNYLICYQTPFLLWKQGRATKLYFTYRRMAETAPAQHYCYTGISTADLYLWAGITHSNKTWLLAGMQEPRVTNTQRDNDMYKFLLFTLAGSITSKVCAEHRWMALCWKAKPSYAGRSEAFPSELPDKGKWALKTHFHWFKAELSWEHHKFQELIYLPMILINLNENHKT